MKRYAWTVIVVLSACVAPAWNASQYHAKLVATAEEAVSAIQTVRLALAEVEQHTLFSNAVDVAISNQEDALSSVSGTFASIQPPHGTLDDDRRKVLDLLDKAQTEVEQARIEYRRGDIASARAHIESLTSTEHQLQKIADS